jgi:hypothetical protein
MLTFASAGVTAQSATATASVGDVEISTVGETGETSVVLDVGNGLSAADVTVSVDTSIAEISAVSEGEDINSDQNTVEYVVVEQSPGSVSFEYTAPQGSTVTEDLEFAVVEFQAVNQGQTEIGITTDNFNDQSYNEYDSVNEVSGSLSVESGGTNGDEGEEDEEEDEEGTGGEDGTSNEDEDTEQEGGEEQTEQTQNVSDGDGIETDTGDEEQTENDTNETEIEGNGAGNSETTDEDRSDMSQNGTSTGSDTENGTETDGGQGLPGFGVVATVTALLSVGAYRRLR